MMTCVVCDTPNPDEAEEARSFIIVPDPLWRCFDEQRSSFGDRALNDEDLQEVMELHKRLNEEACFCSAPAHASCCPNSWIMVHETSAVAQRLQGTNER